MKKIILSLTIVFATVFTAQSQVNPHAIGLRSGGGGNGYGFGNEISYQHGLGDVNRLELDLGFRSHRNGGFGGDYKTSYTTISGVYHWVMSIEGGFNWFVGPGAQIGVGSYSYNLLGTTYSDSWLSIGLGGQIGVEYDFNEFDVPILLGFDIRPMLYLANGGSNFNGDGALSIRYIF